jgi:negative regulator of flagellin synthesis FlgM
MKVNGSTDGIRVDLPAGKAPARSGGSGAAGASAAPTVRLSGASTSLAASENAPEFDAAKVDQVKQAIRDGRFAVDAGVVADKMIASVSDLFGPLH